MLFSSTDGLTLSASQSGTVTKIVFDGDGLAGVGMQNVLYTYDLTGGALNAVAPSSNGQLQYNEDTNQMGIFKSDKNGRDFRTPLASAISNNATGRILLKFRDDTQARSFEFDGTDNEGVYNGTFFRIPITKINGGTAGDGGLGAEVEVEIELDNQIMGPGDAFRLPGGGDTFDSVVTMLNGITGGITLNHGAGITTAGGTATGITIGIDPTSTIKVAGISCDSGATFGGNIHFTGGHIFTKSSQIRGGGSAGSALMILDLEESRHSLQLGEAGTERNHTILFINDVNKEYTFSANGGCTVDIGGKLEVSGLVSATAGIAAAGATFTDIIRARGLTLGTAGIVFSDATTTTSAIRTEAYTGQIETASDKTYTIDPKVATARTITGFYIKSASGTVTATMKNGSDTVKAASVSSSSGDQTSLANTSVAADAVLTIVTSSNSSALDVIFNIEYTS